jgi:hypothetical protein
VELPHRPIPGRRQPRKYAGSPFGRVIRGTGSSSTGDGLVFFV